MENTLMKFMNESEIDHAVAVLNSDPFFGKAVRFLSNFRHEVNEHSDGWAYCPAPAKAARQLMILVESGVAAKRGYFGSVPVVEINDKALAKALAPIKSFMTRRGFAAGMKMPEAA